MYDLKGCKSCCPRPRTGQFLRTWRVRGQGQGLHFRGQGLQKLSSRTRTSSRPPPLITNHLITIAAAFLLCGSAVRRNVEMNLAKSLQTSSDRSNTSMYKNLVRSNSDANTEKKKNAEVILSI